jgi:hypothetical protein
VSRSAWIGLFVGVIFLGFALAVVAAVVTKGGGTTATSTSIQTTSSTQAFDLPIALHDDALALAQHRGDVLVGLAAEPGGPLEVVALKGATPVASGDVKITIDGEPVETSACGRGCSRVATPVLDGRPLKLAVTAGGTEVAFTLPAQLPASGAPAFARARRTMAALRSYHFTERLSSGRGAIFTRLDVQAPNRLRLRTNTGYRSVIIGDTRWDFIDRRWQRQSFPGLNVREALMWYDARTPRVLRRDANGDTELTAFSLKPVPSWFTLTVEPSGRVSQAEMTAPSHFMLHRYSEFDRGARITPPR